MRQELSIDAITRRQAAHPAAVAAARAKDAALAPGTVMVTGNGRYVGVFYGGRSRHYATYAQAERWVHTRKSLANPAHNFSGA